MHIDVIDPKKTAMIVVDMQNDFVASGAAMETPAAREVVPKLAEALRICRDAGIKIIYTAHVHRRDGCDMGLFDDLHPPIANRNALVDATPRRGMRCFATTGSSFCRTRQPPMTTQTEDLARCQPPTSTTPRW